MQVVGRERLLIRRMKTHASEVTTVPSKSTNIWMGDECDEVQLAAAPSANNIGKPRNIMMINKQRQNGFIQ